MSNTSEPLPKGTVGYFFNSTGCPAETRPYEAARGRAIVIGTPQDPQPDGSSIAPLASGEVRKHAHKYTTSLATGAVKVGKGGRGGPLLADRFLL